MSEILQFRAKKLALVWLEFKIDFSKSFKQHMKPLAVFVSRAAPNNNIIKIEHTNLTN